LIPIEIELQNFLAYRQPDPLQLEGIHIACLAGPNGAGKSSLLDAITWALWGKARSNSADALIHQGQDEMRVALTFEQNAVRYKVMRQRKAGKRGASLLELQGWDPETQTWRSLAEGTMRDTQARIDSLLRLDYETFVNSAFLMQGRADEFTTKTPNQRKQVLASILGLSRWESFEQNARQRVSDTQSTIQRIDGRLQEIDRELERKEMYSAELQTAEKEAASVSQTLEAAVEQWSSLEQLRNLLVSQQRQIDDLTRRIQTTDRELEEAHEEKAHLLAQADKDAIHAALATLSEELSKLDASQEKASALEQQRQGQAEEAAKLRGVNQSLGPDTEPIKARLAVLKTAEDPTCPTCGQALSDDHRHQLVEELDREIHDRREQYRKNHKRIQELEQSLAALDGEINTFKNQLRQRPRLEKHAGELQAAIAHADEAAQRLQALEARIQRWQDERAADQKARQALEEEAVHLEHQLREASLTQADLDRLRLEKRKADERVGGARQQLAALDALETQRSQRVEEWNTAAQELALYEDLREAFSKRGVPAMIIETAVPELERAANELLARMTDGRMHVRIETQREIKTGELREALDIIISDELGSRPYELYSGGEAFRINFAIRIALSQLLARRAGAQLRSLFMDEGFGTQDARGREHLVAAINSIQDEFDRILVITHIDELKDAFPARIEISKTPQGSQFRLT